MDIRLTQEQTRRLTDALKIVMGDINVLPEKLVAAAERNRRYLDEYAALRSKGSIRTIVSTTYTIERIR